MLFVEDKHGLPEDNPDSEGHEAVPRPGDLPWPEPSARSKLRLRSDLKQPVDSVIQWLLEGDPAIRWQTLRDLVGASERAVEQERTNVRAGGADSRHADWTARGGTHC